MNQLSTKAVSILSAIAAGATTAKEVAEKMGVSTQTVTGSMAGLKGTYVEVNEGKLALTADGKKAAGVEEKAAPKAKAEKPADNAGKRAEGKAARSRVLYAELIAQGKKRGEIINEFVAKLGLSKAAASTYIQNAKKAIAKEAAAK